MYFPGKIQPRASQVCYFFTLCKKTNILLWLGKLAPMPLIIESYRMEKVKLNEKYISKQKVNMF